jgi:hypothetical protein
MGVLPIWAEHGHCLGSKKLDTAYSHTEHATHCVQLMLGRYLEAMKRLYPALANRAVVRPGNEGTVYVYIAVPLDDERNSEIHETMAEIGAQMVVDTGIVIVLMP